MDKITVVALEDLPKISRATSVSCCLALSILYVASLYVWKDSQQRNHPSTVKKRFCSVSIVMLIAPIFVYNFSSKELLKHCSLFEILGLRWKGLVAAFVIPSLLTALLFLGPLSVQLYNGHLQLYSRLQYWNCCINNVHWLRNHVVAPLSEEFTFRACMMPLILQSFTPVKSVFITPLFFGVAHFHHISERLRSGLDIKTAVIVSCFQLTYTTLFGFYSAYLFAKTGHFIAPVIAHAICNHMGFPEFQELFQQNTSRKIIFCIIYVLGLIGWIVLLPVVTNPSWYGNTLFWRAAI
ncbi:CAAX prenyl protease 2 [Episyrphus balteatus]|uniref:CAAX prenyl protease 2 n=1 Tax=Episyrphus balteatus TaxID=286459 RepID=UPI0024852EBE|nr:CAAX prenyl protease 2 [Episyrphus balteatus]